MITVDILSPEWSKHLEAEAVFLPGALGEFEVLKNHAPIISLLTRGRIRWRIAGEEQSMEINGGVMSLRNNRMEICVEA